MSLNVGILGATGYTGVQLLSLLIKHPDVRIAWLTSEKFAGQKIQEVFPYLRNFSDLLCTSVAKLRDLEKVDLAFSCLPHGTSMHFTARLLDTGARVIDFSADFRFNRVDTYESLFKTGHKYKDYLNEAVYGLPEIFRDSIRGARLVANPGCYSTGVILGLAPLLKEGLVREDSVIADAKSGDSGGGRAPTLEHHYPEMNENVRLNPTAATNQEPEMEEVITGFSDTDVKVAFIPHTVSVNRGILTTIYCRLNEKADFEYIYEIYDRYYRNEPFVRLYGNGRFPELKDVRYTNICGIGVGFQDDVLVSAVALDNLVKGASGQAVQNMNIMFGLPETRALDHPGLYP